ncbi:MAG: Maf family protein [Psychromonas sp.]
MSDIAIYLASNSPRRQELLQQIGVSFAQLQVSIEEKAEVDEDPKHYVKRLALSKAEVGYANSAQDKPVLGADTIIVSEQKIFEKPLNQKHAKQMLQLLSGRTHQVLTAVALVDGVDSKTVLVTTEVTFKNLTDQEMDDYWLSGEPQDKAAGYGIQGIAGKFVTNISGSYSAVVGLPLYETAELIKQFQFINK